MNREEFGHTADPEDTRSGGDLKREREMRKLVLPSSEVLGD